MSGDRSQPVVTPASKDVAAFLDRARQVTPATTPGTGRLVFALDATMSRQPTWDSACVLQAEMFQEAAASGGLAIQLVYFRGLAECRASGFVSQADKLAALMREAETTSARGLLTAVDKMHMTAEKLQTDLNAASASLR